MSTVEVFEPPLCCATGVCGPDLDQALVAFSADVEWVRARGGDARRYNLASEPVAFAENAQVRQFLELSGSAGLPLTLVDGVTALTGSYPSRTRIAGWTGVEADDPAGQPVAEGALDVVAAAETGCCGSGPQASGCC